MEQNRDFVMRYRINDTHPIEVKAFASVLKDSKGKIIGMIGELYP